MIAPYFKQMAEQYKDRAVFAKVDINANYQTASEQMIRSMPTFQLYLFGKKRDQFSGADTNRLNTMLQALMTESQTKNVEITHEALKSFYQEHSPEKLAELDDKKLTDILEKAGKGGGPGHYGLVQALKKKYNGKSPKTRPRTTTAKAEGQKPPPQTSSKTKADPAKPNLQLASLQELQAEIDKRREEEEEKKAEAATDEDEAAGSFPIYDPKNRTDEIEQVCSRCTYKSCVYT
jgi:thioredoxin-like negative regulator of GroEL